MILATAVAGPLSIASRGLNTSLVTKDQITAFFLAQDAIEYVRYVRDSNRLKGADWLTGSGGSSAGIDLVTACGGANGCYLDSTQNSPSTPQACSGTCPTLYYNTASGLYTYTTSGNTKTLFTRRIQLQNVGTKEYRIYVTVSWSDIGDKSRQVVVYENIFDWQ